MAKVLVIAEVKGGQIKKPSLELISQAKQLNLPCEAVLIGYQVSSLADTLAAQGVSKVYIADSESLALYNTGAYTAATVDAVRRSEATQVWLTSSEQGADLTPRVAMRLGVGAITDVSAIEADGDQLKVKRSAMATKVVQQCVFTKDGVRVLSMRSGAFDVAAAAGGSATVEALDIPELDQRALVKEVVAESSGDAVELSDASIVVSVGRGVKGPEGIEFVKPLADVLGAGYGASRAVCDAGWMSHGAQVGQTGKVVTPDFYFAVGISGAIQHLAGMSGSKKIIAVNKDPDAPIFKVADYGIVGDLFKVVPLLIDRLGQHKS